MPLLFWAQASVVGPDTEMMKWAYQTGGPLLVLILIILFFYRRDALSSLKDSEAKNTVVVELAKTVASAMTASTAETARMSRSLELFCDEHRKH